MEKKTQELILKSVTVAQCLVFRGGLSAVNENCIDSF